MNFTRFLRFVGAAALFASVASVGHAQWLTQAIDLKPGWNSVFLHVDAAYSSLDALVGSDPSNPIDEVWLWKAPTSTMQYIISPASPLTAGRDWAPWSRSGAAVPIALAALIPNAAYLVHSVAATNYTWRIKGKPVAPSYTWTTTGLNFIGFPTPANNPPAFDTFLSLSPAFAGAAEVHQYRGGDLGPSNPSQIISLHATKVTRGQAYWIRAGSVFNDYFGPFQVSLGGNGAVALGSAGSQSSVYLKNSTTSNLLVCVSLLSSETPPAGQTPIAGKPPVLVRGSLIASNLTYAFTDLSGGGSACWTLKPKGQPGSEIAVVLGANRTAMTNPGAVYAGILRFTDALNLSQVDVPVSAQAASATGLWVGKALVTQVGNYLKTYQVDVNNNLVTDTNGTYVVTGINTNLGAVTQPFPLRLILHNDGTNVVLLQRVYYGPSVGSNLVVATRESALDPQHLATARRISAAGFPWTSANDPWPCLGQLVPGSNLTVTLSLAYDDHASNPFLHTFHPDHDNLDATSKNKLPRGSESYDITRQITLKLNPPGNDFASLTAAGQSLYGTYSETITVFGLGDASRDFNVSGAFTLTRISPIANLTRL